MKLYKLLCSLLILFLILDIEFQAGQITGGGERLGNSHVLENSILVNNTSTSVGLKISDFLILFTSIILLFSSVKHSYTKIKKFLDLKFYILFIIFIIYNVVVTILNNRLVTNSQFITSLIYIVKLFEISLIYLIFYTYFTNFKITTRNFNVFIMVSALSGVIGIINTFTGVFNGWIIEERVSFYGVHSCILLFLITIYLTYKNNYKFINIKRETLIFIILILALSVLLCGKRTVVVSTVVGVLYVMYKTIDKYNINTITVIGIFGLLIAGGELYQQYIKTFHSPYLIGDGLNEKYSYLVSESVFNNLGTLDLSTAERIGKFLYSLEFIYDNPFFGIGYFYSQYVYNYLPDSNLQLIIETGSIGIVLLAIPNILMFKLHKHVNKGHKKDEKVLFIVWKGIFYTLFIMGIASSVAYIYKLVAIYFVITAWARQRYLTN